MTCLRWVYGVFFINWAVFTIKVLVWEKHPLSAENNVVFCGYVIFFSHCCCFFSHFICL